MKKVKLFILEWYCRNFHSPEPRKYQGHESMWYCDKCKIEYSRRLTDNDTGAP